MALHQIMGALGDPTRFAIVEALLKEGEKSAGALAEPFNMSKPAISRHLKVLEQSGLIERRTKAQFRVFSIRAAGFGEIDDWMSKYREFWNGSFDRLEAILKKSGEDENE
ncbi:MAG: winged helix-turn-helix transcriptional regulator [Rhizobiaceae bacterium]|nr:winged helix-turn-helix transcriptional regulator [Rhizobiaceae bacterium]MBL4695498.1 winged helix-turn-helix transcriptional regulator [Rhizobiaceae bacterium]